MPILCPLHGEPGGSRIRTRTDFDWENNSGNAAEMCYWINETIEYYFRQNERDIKNFLERMEASCRNEILPPEEFNWFRDDKRICLWLWHQTIHYSRRYDDTFPDHRGRFKAILEHFDSMDKAGDQKRESLNILKGDWQRKGNTPDPFSNESTETINYLWNYTVKLHDNINRYFSPISDDDSKYV